MEGKMNTETQEYQLPEQIKSQLEHNLGPYGPDMSMALEIRVNSNPNSFDSRLAEEIAERLTLVSEEVIGWLSHSVGFDTILDVYVEGEELPLEAIVFDSPVTDNSYLVCGSAFEVISQYAEINEVSISSKRIDLEKDPKVFEVLIYHLQHERKLIVEDICPSKKFVYRPQFSIPRGISPHQINLIKDIGGERSANYRTLPTVKKMNPEKGTWMGDEDLNGIPSDRYSEK